MIGGCLRAFRPGITPYYEFDLGVQRFCVVRSTRLWKFSGYNCLAPSSRQLDVTWSTLPPTPLQPSSKTSGKTSGKPVLTAGKDIKAGGMGKRCVGGREHGWWACCGPPV